MTEKTQPPATSEAEPRKRKNWSKRNILIASVGVVALAGGAAFGIPKLVHAQEVSKYHEAASALAEANKTIFNLHAEETAAVGLSALHAEEVGTLADELSAMGKLGEPVFSKEHAELLTKAGGDLAEAVEIPDERPEQSVSIVDAIEELRDSDAAAAEHAKADDEDAPQPTAPDSYLELSLDAAVNLLTTVTEVDNREPVADIDIDRAVVEALEARLKEAETAVASTQKQRDTAVNELDALSELLDETLSSLAEIATTAPTSAEAVAKASPKAGNTDKLTKVAGDAADATPGTLEMKNALSAYVAEAKNVQAAHKKAVDQAAAEAEAAAAAASGAAGYTDPGTGTYVDFGTGGGWIAGNTGGGSGYVPPASSGGGYVPPASSGGGGSSYVPPATGGGGGSTGGGGGGASSGYTPPVHTCPAPPAGWFPTGGTGNGCPTYLPPGGDNTEGW